MIMSYFKKKGFEGYNLLGLGVNAFIDFSVGTFAQNMNHLVFSQFGLSKFDSIGWSCQIFEPFSSFAQLVLLQTLIDFVMETFSVVIFISVQISPI